MTDKSQKVMEELRKNSILMRRSFRGCHGEITLNVGGQGKLLSILMENPGISQKTLAELLHVRPQTLGEQLVKLETSGLIERRTNDYDKRVINIFLTDSGAASAKELSEKSEETIAQIFADMQDDELDQLLTLVQKLNASIENNVDMAELDHPHGTHHPHGHHPHGCNGGCHHK